MRRIATSNSQKACSSDFERVESEDWDREGDCGMPALVDFFFNSTLGCEDFGGAGRGLAESVLMLALETGALMAL